MVASYSVSVLFFILVVCLFCANGVLGYIVNLCVNMLVTLDKIALDNNCSFCFVIVLFLCVISAIVSNELFLAAKVLY